MSTKKCVVGDVVAVDENRQEGDDNAQADAVEADTNTSEDIFQEVDNNPVVAKRKSNACFFCNKIFVKISEHMKNMHGHEPEMVRIHKSRMPDLQERRKEYQKLVAQANNRYNKNVKLEQGSNVNPNDYIMKYKRRDKFAEKIAEEELTPCCDCGAMYRNDSLFRHKCVQQKYPKEKNRQIRSESNKKWNLIQEVSPEMNSLLDQLLVDDISNIILSDKTILEYGEEKLQGMLQTKKFDNNQQEKKDRLRQSLRNAARYLKIFREVTGKPNLKLKATYKSEYLKYVPTVGQKYGNDYEHPDSVKKLQNILGKILKRLVAHTENTKQFHKWSMLDHHFRYKWANTITKNVTTAKTLHNVSKKFELPTAAEINLFKDFVNTNLNLLLDKNIETYSDYLELVRYTVTRITSFNYRRSGEVSRMTTEQFKNKDKSASEEEFNIPISRLEKACAKIMTSVTLKGKSPVNEVVLAILPPNCVQAIEKILCVKSQFPEIGAENKFVFATKGSKNYHINGYQAMKTIVEKTSIRPLRKFTASKLRKYIATHMLWTSIPKSQRKLLASHMGHLLGTQENVYIEHLRSGTARYYKLPAMLMNFEAGLSTKTYDEMTDEDVIQYVKNTAVKHVRNNPDETGILNYSDDDLSDYGSYSGQESNSDSQDEDEENNQENIIADQSEESNLDDKDKKATDKQTYTKKKRNTQRDSPKDCHEKSDTDDEDGGLVRVNRRHKRISFVPTNRRKYKWTYREENIVSQRKTVRNQCKDKASSDSEDDNRSTHSQPGCKKPTTQESEYDDTDIKSSSDSEDDNRPAPSQPGGNPYSEVSNSKSKYKNSTRMKPKSALGIKRRHRWTANMKKILIREFSSQLQKKNAPILKAALVKCQTKLLKECGRTITIGCIRSTVVQMRKKMKKRR